MRPLLNGGTLGGLPRPGAFPLVYIMAPLPTEADFIAATLSAFPDGLALDIAVVLNMLSAPICKPAKLIAHVDGLMSILYDRGVLTCPGHRWSNTPVPSIAGHLSSLLESGKLRWSLSAGWTSHRVTSIYALRLERLRA